MHSKLNAESTLMEVPEDPPHGELGSSRALVQDNNPVSGCLNLPPPTPDHGALTLPLVLVRFPRLGSMA